MPTYSLKCLKCNYEWSDMMSLSERDEAKCPKCNTKAETNWSSQGTVLIQGKGFYQENKLR